MPSTDAPTFVLPDLGINSQSIAFEVAIELIGQQTVPLARQLRKEREQGREGQAYSRYLEAVRKALFDLQAEITPSDTELIVEVSNPNNLLLRTQRV